MKRPGESREARAVRVLGRALARSRQRERRARGVLQAVPDALFGLDEAGRVISANAGLTRVFGLEPGDVLGRPLAALLPGLDAEGLRTAMDEGILLAGGSRLARRHGSACRADGTVFPIALTLTGLPPGEALRYALAVHDTTEERATQDRLDLVSQALEAARNGIVIAEVEGGGERVVYTNPAFSRITGYAGWELIGGSCRVLQGEADRHQPGLRRLGAALRAGEPITEVLHNRRKDGQGFYNELSLAPVRDAGGRLRHYVGVLSDVTDRVRAEQAMAERGARLEALFALSPDGFALFDAGGRWVHANQAFFALSGWNPAVLGQGWDRARFDAELAAAAEPEAAAAADGGALAGHLQLIRPQRRILAWTERHAAVVHGAAGETLVHFRDVTRETEVDRMKSEFLSTAAHELRTPMVSIFGFSELLLRRPVPPARQREVLEIVHRQAALLVRLLNELLDLARIEARQGKDFCIGPHEAAGLLREAVEAFCVPEGREPPDLRLPAPGWSLMVDPDKTRQALLNVLSNAYKYSPAGGPVAVDVQVEPGPPARLGLRVRDHGLGMSPAEQARVCERFYRADPSGNIPGTGLGMSLVREIVELQGGRVALQSAPGQGTEVCLWLPARQGVPGQAPAPAGATGDAAACTAT